MGYTLIFHPEAEEEYNEAIWWYSNQQKVWILNLFVVDEAIEKIKRNPELYPFEFENFRKKVIKRFPFKIIYEVIKDYIFILAVSHFRRNSEQIRSRSI